MDLKFFLEDLFDREFAIDRVKFWQFLETTQAEELAKLKDRPNCQRLILERQQDMLEMNEFINRL